jgi:hypothetical protein
MPGAGSCGTKTSSRPSIDLLGIDCCGRNMAADPGAAASAVVTKLEQAGVPCAIGGALCLAYWGVPRATRDLDINVFVGESELATVLDSLEAAGCVVDRPQSLTRVRDRGDMVADFDGIRVDVFIAFHDYHEHVARRVVRGVLPDGPEASFLSAEDLCVFKTLFHRAKDLVDLDRLFAALGRSLDIDYVLHWLGELLGPDDRRPIQLEHRFARVVDTIDRP